MEMTYIAMQVVELLVPMHPFALFSSISSIIFIAAL